MQDKTLVHGTWHQLCSTSGDDENTIDSPQRIIPCVKTIERNVLSRGIIIPAFSLNIIILSTE